jgi:hypothetical protein
VSHAYLFSLPPFIVPYLLLLCPHTFRTSVVNQKLRNDPYSIKQEISTFNKLERIMKKVWIVLLMIPFIFMGVLQAEERTLPEWETWLKNNKDAIQWKDGDLVDFYTLYTDLTGQKKQTPNEKGFLNIAKSFLNTVNLQIAKRGLKGFIKEKKKEEKVNLENVQLKPIEKIKEIPKEEHREIKEIKKEMKEKEEIKIKEEEKKIIPLIEESKEFLKNKENVLKAEKELEKLDFDSITKNYSDISEFITLGIKRIVDSIKKNELIKMWDEIGVANNDYLSETLKLMHWVTEYKSFHTSDLEIPYFDKNFKISHYLDKFYKAFQKNSSGLDQSSKKYMQEYFEARKSTEQSFSDHKEKFEKALEMFKDAYFVAFKTEEGEHKEAVFKVKK